MKRRRHTPEQVVGKLAEGERILNGGGDLAAVLRTLEISEPCSMSRAHSARTGLPRPLATRARHQP